MSRPIDCKPECLSWFVGMECNCKPERALVARLDQMELDRKDAERYRWLRDHGGARYQVTASQPEGYKPCITMRVPSFNESGTYQLQGTAADSAIDEEMLRTNDLKSPQ